MSSEYVPLATALIVTVGGGVGYLVKRWATKADAKEQQQVKDQPTLQQIVGEQTRDLFARYEARLAALEKRDEERERKLQQVEQERDRLANDNTRLLNRVSQLEDRVQELETELASFKVRPTNARTRASDREAEA